MKRIGLAAATLVFASGACAADAGLDVVTGTGRHHYQVEIAGDEASREHGLMDRREMSADHGMLFEFPTRAAVVFWMKDTYLPLDMAFIDSNGVVRRVVEHATPMSEALIPSGAPVTGVLELNAGQAATIHLKAGDKVLHPFFKP